MNTITAIATSLGNGAISIVRLSGENALEISKKVFSSSSLDYKTIIPRYLYLGKLTCPTFTDHCLLVYFKAPFSYTGEDLVEFQCHGGRKVAVELLSALLSHGAVIASKGEFSKRAFVNGKMSLSEAEGVIDMINAESSAELACGYRLLSGGLNSTMQSIQSLLLDTIAGYEAVFDYPDEMEDEAIKSAMLNLNKCISLLARLNNSYAVGKYISNGINIAIIGQPNSGKSSLLNALLGREKAIVTDIAGTTRDTVEGRVEHNGVMLNFIDTAGIRESSDTVEIIGIERARQAAKTADMVLVLLDSTRKLTKQEKTLLGEFCSKENLVLLNKCDVTNIAPSITSCYKKLDCLELSAKTGHNVTLLLDTIVQRFINVSIDANHDIITNVRHSDCISRALAILKNTVSCLDTTPIECLIIDLNLCYELLGEITGDTCSEDVIDRIFQKFCLGK